MNILKPFMYLWENYKELVLAIIITIVLTIMVTAVVTSSVYLFKKEECNSKAIILNTESSFGLFQGCFIKYKEKWIDYDRYITIMK